MSTVPPFSEEQLAWLQATFGTVPSPASATPAAGTGTAEDTSAAGPSGE